MTTPSAIPPAPADRLPLAPLLVVWAAKRHGFPAAAEGTTLQPASSGKAS